MSNDITYLRERFAATDPAPPPEHDDAELLDAQGEATLRRIMDTPRARGHPLWWAGAQHTAKAS